MRDLSHPSGRGCRYTPAIRMSHLAPALTLDTDGAAVTALKMGSHTGTHVDAPSHTVQGGRTMADVGLDELVGEAIVIRVPGLVDREVYDWSRLTAAQLPRCAAYRHHRHRMGSSWARRQRRGIRPSPSTQHENS